MCVFKGFFIFLNVTVGAQFVTIPRQYWARTKGDSHNIICREWASKVWPWA